MSNNVLGTIRAGLCSLSKNKKDENNNAPEEVVATAAATSTKTGATAFGSPFTQQVADKTTRLKNDNKDNEDDGSGGSSYKDDVSETEKDSENLGNDKPPVIDEQSHLSVVCSMLA